MSPRDAWLSWCELFAHGMWQWHQSEMQHWYKRTMELKYRRFRLHEQQALERRR